MMTRSTDRLDTLITATVTGLVIDDDCLNITARSLSGKYRNYLITIEGERLDVKVFTEGVKRHDKEC